MICNRKFGRLGRLAMVAGLFTLMGSALAAAAPALVLTNLNMRQGPGTNFGIITTIPGGSTVEVTGCTGEWCNVVWGAMGGYAVARNLDLGGPAPVQVAPVVVAPAPIIIRPRYWGPRYYGGGYYYGPRVYRRF
jgi:uncharacterized protein YraI